VLVCSERKKYCWLVVAGWFVLREKCCWLVADKPNEQGNGSVTTVVHPPVKGTLSDSAHFLAQSYSEHSRFYVKSGGFDMARNSSHHKLPKLNFPVFEGESPKIVD
jgi:hypothetical protein